MNKMFRICISLAPVCVFIGAISISAQWNKPYSSMSEKDARKLLNDSPWGQTRVYSYTSNKYVTSGPARPGGAASSNPISQYLNVRIRFLSARPIREAFSRMMLVGRTAQVADQLATQLNTFTTQEFPNEIVVSVDCDSTERLNEFWEFKLLLDTRSTIDLKPNTYLSAKGQRTYLESFHQPISDGVGAKFIFPRTVNGRPAIPPDSDDLQFYSEISDKYKLNMRFKTKDMVFDGRLEY